MSDAEHDALMREYRAIAERISDATADRPLVAVYLALGAILGNIEMKAASPNRRQMFRLMSQGMDEFIGLNSPDAAKHLAEAKIEEAVSITIGACDFCPAVHVNLRDQDGDIFATASVPVVIGEDFIARFRAAMAELATRHSAPVRRQ